MVNDKMVNIFDQVGKRTPFRTPDGFFEASEQTLRAQIPNHKSPYGASKSVEITNHKLPITNRYWTYGIAASLVLAVGIWSLVRFLPQPTQTPAAEEPVYAQTYDTSDDWHDFAEADLFLDNMNW